MAEKTLHGKCLCGAVTFEATPEKQHVEACHCDMCRRWGSFLSVQCGQNVRFTGEEHIGVFASSDWAERSFCKICGSSLYYRFTPANNYSIAAGILDDSSGLSLTEQIFIDEKPDYYDFAQDTPKKTGAEIIAEAKAAGFEFD